LGIVSPVAGVIGSTESVTLVVQARVDEHVLGAPPVIADRDRRRDRLAAPDVLAGPAARRPRCPAGRTTRRPWYCIGNVNGGGSSDRSGG